MANITVSYSEMESAAARLGTGREEITTQLLALQREIQGLVSSGFVTDTASKKFGSMYDEYTAGANQVIENLSEIQRFITETAGALREMDGQIAARIN